MDRQAWQDFFITVFLLGLAFVIAILSSVAAQQGEVKLAAASAGISLLIALAGAVYIVPRLARKVQLEFIRFAVRTSVTVEGLFFILLLVVIGFAAWNTANNLLYLILSVLLSFLFAANLISRLSLSAVSIQLRFPDHIFAAEPANISVTVTNHKRLIPTFSLTVEPVSERDAQGRTVAARSKGVLSKAGPRTTGNGGQENERLAGEAARQKNEGWRVNTGGRRDRTAGAGGSGKPRVRDLGKLAHFIAIPAKATSTQKIEHKFEKRGSYPITAFRISTRFPTGFFVKWRKVDATGEILVYPKPRPLDDFYHALPMLAGQVTSHVRGTGDDLYGLRRYHPSDHMRHIDWKATAKSRGLMVRDHTREDERRLTIVFDTSMPQASRIVREDLGGPAGKRRWRGKDRRDANTTAGGIEATRFAEKFETAVVMAASLANHFTLEGAEVELVTVDESTRVGSGKGSDHLYDILGALATVEPLDSSPLLGYAGDGETGSSEQGGDGDQTEDSLKESGLIVGARSGSGSKSGLWRNDTRSRGLDRIL
ncbi:MAG TPA: DUF58 domain-containing protein, partial [Blastocatellia bacterium]|nr:DUF58 domain-containing protein [Blastocatellia bacterium]